MEGYTNLGGSHVDFNDLDIEGRISDDRKQDKTKRGSDAKKEESGQEEQKRLLQIKVKVDDGNYGYVFSVQKRDSVWRWKCHLCDVVIVGQTHVETHIQSKKHQVKMGVLVHERDLFTRFEGEPAPIEDIELEPGEPAPPGLEATVLKKRGIAQIQAILDCHRSSPLIGLEYLVELTPDERDSEPMYVCTLCDKKGDPRVAMAHLTSFNHRSKYIGINFPMANRAVNNSMPRTKEGRRGVAEILTRICSKIEEKHGRLMPLVLQQEAYLAKKDFYHLQIENDYHFRETPSENYMDIAEQDAILPNSVNVDDVPLPEKEPSKPEEVRRKITVDRSRLRTHASRNESKHSSQEDTGRSKKGARRSSLSSVSSSSLSRSPSPPRSRSKSRTKSSSPSAVRRRVRSRSRDRSRGQASRRSRRSRSPRGIPKRSRSRSPRGIPKRSRTRSPRGPLKRSSRSRSASRGRYRNYGRHDKPPVIYPNTALAEKDKWTKFRTESDKIERDLNKMLKFHEKNPEKHPMYPDEWKKFWNVRYKELQADGKDPSKHDFKPEWIQFWNKRMKEMHDDEFNLKKEQLREKLDLPKEKTPPPPYPRAPRPPDMDADVIVISPTPMLGPDFGPKRWKAAPAPRRVESERKRSLSPWDKDDVPVHKASRPKWQPPRYDEGSRRKDAYEENSRRKESYEESSRRKESYEENSRRKDSYEESSRRKDSYGEESSRRKDAYVAESSRRKDSYNSPAPLRPVVDDDLEPQAEQKEKRVVTVIRLLTALESQLGSIGPAVNNLLASALAMEKTRPGASESLLGNPDNLVLFETVKEKLKGQLFAGIVEPGLVMATRSCIQNLAEMLFRAEKMPRIARSVPAPVVVAIPVSKPAPVVTVPGVGAMDKAAIATQIAAALVAEGRGDVTQAELESLINAVIGMAQASVTLDKPITAAAFVSQMQPVAAPAPVPAPTLAPAPTPAPALDQKSPLEKLLSVVQLKTTPVENVKCLFPSTVERVVEPPPRREPTPPPQRMSLVDMEELTESDLKALLQNFKDLSTDEQYCLITYLKKIEAKEPDRVENLRQFVNLAPFQNVNKTANTSVNVPDKEKGAAGRLSPFSLRMGQANPSVDESYKKTRLENQESENALKLKLDDSDDDYSFDDICAAASKKVNEKEQEARELVRKATDEAINQMTSDKSKEDDANNILRETKLMIANLMGQLPGKFVQKRLTPSPGPAKSSTPTTVTTTTTDDLPILSRSNAGLKIDISNTLTDAAACDMFSNPKPVPKPTLLGNFLPGNPNLTGSNLGSATVPNTTLYEGIDASFVNNVFNTSYPIQDTNFNGTYGQQPFPNSQQSFPNNQIPLVGYPNQQYSGQYHAGNFMAANVNNGFYSEPVQQHAQYPQQQGSAGNFAQPQQGLAQPGNYSQPQQGLAQPGNFSQPPQGLAQPGNLPQPRQGLAHPGNFSQPPQGLAQPGNLPQPRQGLVQPGNFSQPRQGLAQPGNFSQPRQGLTQPIPTQFRPQGYPNQQVYNQYQNQQQGFY